MTLPIIVSLASLVLSITDFNYSFMYMFSINILTLLLPALFAIAYYFIIFRILNNQKKWKLVMILNAILIVILSVSIAMLIYYGTDWFTMDVIVRFTITMIVICLLTIALTIINYLQGNKKYDISPE